MQINKKIIIRIFIFILFIPYLLHADSEQVKRVIDGDTFELVGGVRVRLIGVDTPEYHDSQKLYRDAERTKRDIKTIKALGKKSSDFVKGILSKTKKVFLEYDQANTHISNKDRYGRTLAYVYVELPHGPPKGIDRDSLVLKIISGKEYLFLNATIIKAGYGNAYTSYPFQYMEDFRAYEREARGNSRGLWGDEKAISESVTTVKLEKYYLASKNSKVFHRPSCKHVESIKKKNIIRFKDRPEAVDSGRRPCRGCYP